MWICLALFNVILFVFIITYLWSQMSNAISTTKLLNNCWFEALRQKYCQHCHCQSNCWQPLRGLLYLYSAQHWSPFSSSASSSPPVLVLGLSSSSAASGLRQLLRQLLLILDSENIALPSNTHLNMKLKGRKLSDTWETNHLQLINQQGRPLLQLAIC